MTRLLALTTVVAALLLAAPVAVALTCTALVPAVLAPVLGGADDRVPPQPTSVPPPGPQGASGRSAVLGWAAAHVGQPYRMGAAGPTAWDCSSFTQAAYARAGVRLPRTAQQQRDWLATGHGTRITPGAEEPGDLIFWDSYLGRDVIGHVVLVHDPRRRRTVEAHNTRAGTGYFTYHPHHHRYEIWRPTLPGPAPEPYQRSPREQQPSGSPR